MSSTVVTRKFYRHPNTGRFISKEAAARFKKKIKPETFLQVLYGPEAGKRKVGKVMPHASARLTEVEKILPLSSFTERSVIQTFGRRRVYQKLWENSRGEIRMTIGGTLDGRRIKEVIHLAYSRSHWQNQGGKEPFKTWIVGSVLSNLRRRGIRLSNPVESQARLQSLRRSLQAETKYLEFVSPERVGAQANKIKAIARDIKLQKESKQLRGATIRMEKLA